MQRSIASIMIRVGIVILGGFLILEGLLNMLFLIGMESQVSWTLVLGFSLVHRLLLMGVALSAIILALIMLKGRLRWQVFLMIAMGAIIFAIYGQMAAIVGHLGRHLIGGPGAVTQGTLGIALMLLTQIARPLLWFGVVSVGIAWLLRRKGTGQGLETGPAAPGRHGEDLSTPTLVGGLERLGDRVESLETILMDRSHS